MIRLHVRDVTRLVKTVTHRAAAVQAAREDCHAARDDGCGRGGAIQVRRENRHDPREGSHAPPDDRHAAREDGSGWA